MITLRLHKGVPELVELYSELPLQGMYKFEKIQFSGQLEIYLMKNAQVLRVFDVFSISINST